ncbi:hypothetical protein Tco_1402892 [Tanacetum coccineum]
MKTTNQPHPYDGSRWWGSGVEVVMALVVMVMVVGVGCGYSSRGGDGSNADDKAYLFSKSDFKYLNKNDIEDICVIWERVYDFQLGIESYQIKVNLTAPTITFPGIETLPLYSVTADPFVGVVNENNKKERMDMNIDELQKFSYATLKRVVKD